MQNFLEKIAHERRPDRAPFTIDLISGMCPSTHKLTHSYLCVQYSIIEMAVSEQVEEKKQKLKKPRARGYFLYFEGDPDELPEPVKRRMRIIARRLQDDVQYHFEKLRRFWRKIEEAFEILEEW